MQPVLPVAGAPSFRSFRNRISGCSPAIVDTPTKARSRMPRLPGAECQPLTVGHARFPLDQRSLANLRACPRHRQETPFPPFTNAVPGAVCTMPQMITPERSARSSPTRVLGVWLEVDKG